MVKRKRLGIVAIATLLAAVTGACGNDDSIDSAAARRYAIDHLTARAGSTSRITFYESVNELLPSVSFRVDSQPPKPLVAAVVVGKVIAVEPGRGFVVDGVDGIDGRAVDFSDPKALWRTVHLTIAVQERLGQDERRETVKVGLR